MTGGTALPVSNLEQRLTGIKHRPLRHRRAIRVFEPFVAPRLRSHSICRSISRRWSGVNRR